MSREVRYDFGDIREDGDSKVTRTPQGFLRVPARLTRTGVLKYRRADGSIQRELRLPAEVFSANAMRTMGGAPVTNLHPIKPVDLDNAQLVSKGWVSENVRQDGDFVKADLIIQDKRLIKAIEDGRRRELSPGYTCRIDRTPGNWDGEPYDVIQRDYTYNHVAALPPGGGRSGSEVRIHMDGADPEGEYMVEWRDDGSSEADQESKQEKSTMETKEITLAGVSYTVEKSAEPHINKHITGLEARADEAEATAKAKTEELDKITAERDQLKTRVDAVEAEAATAASEALKAKALEINEELKLDGLTDREVMEAAIVVCDSEFKADGKSDDYIQARFDLLKPATRDDSKEAIREARRNATPDPESRDDGEDTSVESAYTNMIKNQVNAWRSDQA